MSESLRQRVAEAVRTYDPRSHDKTPCFHVPHECAGCDTKVSASQLRATTVKDAYGGTFCATVWYCEDCRDILQVGESDVVLVEYPHQIRWFR